MYIQLFIHSFIFLFSKHPFIHPLINWLINQLVNLSTNSFIYTSILNTITNRIELLKGVGCVWGKQVQTVMVLWCWVQQQRDSHLPFLLTCTLWTFTKCSSPGGNIWAGPGTHVHHPGRHYDFSNTQRKRMKRLSTEKHLRGIWMVKISSWNDGMLLCIVWKYSRGLFISLWKDFVSEGEDVVGGEKPSSVSVFLSQ